MRYKEDYQSFFEIFVRGNLVQRGKIEKQCGIKYLLAIYM